MDWFSPSVEIVLFWLQFCIPDRLSLHSNSMFTSELFQPFASGSGILLALIVGVVHISFNGFVRHFVIT